MPWFEEFFGWLFAKRGSAAAAERDSGSKVPVLKREKKERIDEYDHLDVDKRLLKTERKEEKHAVKLVKRLKEELLAAGRLSSQQGDPLGKAAAKREAAFLATLVRIDGGSKNLLELMTALGLELEKEEGAERQDRSILEQEERRDATIIKEGLREAAEAPAIAGIERAEAAEEQQEFQQDRKASLVEQWKVGVQERERQAFAKHRQNVQAYTNRIEGLMGADAQRIPRNVLYEYDHVLGLLLDDLKKARVTVGKELVQTKLEKKTAVNEYKEERTEAKAEKQAEGILETEVHQKTA